MIADTEMLLALRARALSLSVRTTGVTALGANATGYSRAAGSFIVDGFTVGMEVNPNEEFSQQTPAIIDHVAIGQLTIRGGRSGHAPNGLERLDVGLPSIRFFENQQATEEGVVIIDPKVDRWFVEEDFVPGPSSQVTGAPFGEIEGFPQYFLKLYSIAGMGTAAPYAVADALKLAFPPRDFLTLASGNVLRINHAPAPFRSQLVPGPPGWAVCTVTIPCSYRTSNIV